jgi:CIC family chloride channel protein
MAPHEQQDTIQSLSWNWFNKQIPTLLLAIAIGILAGYGAVGFHHFIQWVQWLFYQNSHDFLQFSETVPWYLVVLLPALGGLIVGLLVHYGAREAKGHGVPEVMEAMVLREGRIRKRVALVKILASAVCIGSGGSTGREGPMVQIGSSIGSTVGQVFRVKRPLQRTMVGCGAAAGIAATFNAPIAGVLFALEILIGDFGLTAFSPVVLSSVTATTISRHFFGDLPTFIVPEYEVHSLWEFCIYPFLGITCGLAAQAFIAVLYKFEDGFEALKMPDWIKPALGGALLGIIIIRFPQAFGVGYGAMNLALTSKLPAMLLFALIWVKILATSLSIGSGGSGGIFAPSLFIGTMTGGFFGWAAGALFPGVTAAPGAYALVAMGGLVAGTTHAPITAILIIFEMTNDYKIILPLMMTCIIATLVSSSLRRASIYTIKLLRRGIDISGGMEQNILRDLRVGQFMNGTVATAPESATLGTILELFKVKNASYLHIVDASNLLSGIISFRDIRAILGDDPQLRDLVIARDIATTPVIAVTPEDNIRQALQVMSDKGISQLPVVSQNNPRVLIGTLRQKDVVSAYDRAIIRKELEG